MGAIRLNWFNLEARGRGEWFLRIPQCEDVAPVIDAAFPRLRHIGWRQVERHRCFTYYKDLTEDDKNRLEAFLVTLTNALIVRRSSHLAEHFTDELDGCYALDFTYKILGIRTEVGALENRAKYHGDESAAAVLSQKIVAIVDAMPQLRETDLVGAVPSSSGEDPGALPVQLASEVERHTGKTALRLGRAPGTPVKSLPLSKKIEALAGAFGPDRDVTSTSLVGGCWADDGDYDEPDGDRPDEHIAGSG